MIDEKIKTEEAILGWKEEIVSNSTQLDILTYNKNAKPIKEIISTLKTLPLLAGKNKENTHKIKHTFATLGLKGFRYSCYTNQIREDPSEGFFKPPHHYFTNREWLYDLIWFEDEEDTGHEYYIKSFHLALESEWEFSRSKAKRRGVSYAAVKYDFQKLVVCNARLKVMIFREDAKKGIREMNDYIETFLQTYTPKTNGKFLCIAYRNDMKSFIYKIFRA